MELATMKHPVCVRCGSYDVKLRKQITSSGAIQIAWYCRECYRWAEIPQKWLRHDFINAEFKKNIHTKDSTIYNIPTINDSSGDNPCIICGGPGENHHWAPQAYESDFGVEWIAWPTAALCLEHHRQWHNIVTPTLGNHKKEENQ